MISLSGLRIKLRVFTSFAAIVVLGVGVGAFSVWQLGKLGDQMNLMLGVSENATRNLEVAERMESLRLASLRYRTDPAPDVVGEFNRARDEALERLAAAARQTVSDDRRRVYNAVAEGINQYSRDFERLVALTNAMQTDRVTLYKVGNDFTAATGQLVAEIANSDEPDVIPLSRDVEAAMLRVRVATWQFLATADPKGPAIFAADVEKADKALAVLESTVVSIMQRALLTPVRTGLAAYKVSFVKLAETILQSNDLFDKVMRPRIVELATLNDQAKASLQADLLGTKAATDAVISSTTVTQEVLVVGQLALSIVLALLVGRSIAGPVVAMTAAMRKLAAGDAFVEIPARDAKDEIGEMAQAVDVFKENLIRANALGAEQQAEQARKGQRQTAIEGSIASFDQSVSHLLDALGSASNQLQSTAQSMSSTAEETSRQSTAVAAASEQATANVQTIAAATEQLAASVAEITSQVTKSSSIAAKAVEDAERSNKTIEELAQAAQHIGDVAKLITDIASQTNLLALNATIEAARAGDAGKGFAVVASEVKSLANQTSKATGDITGQIDAIQAATEQAVVAIRSVTGTIAQMNEISTRIAAAMEEQGVTTSEITRNAQQAARGTQEVSSSITSVTQAAGETGAASSQVLNSAVELGKQAATLRANVAGFLGEIRAA
jgi:methyl-accepting chemotaxis protein